MRGRRCVGPPGGTSSLHFDSSGRTPLFRNRSVPSRRDSLHFGPKYLAIVQPLHAAFFGWTTSVMRNRRHILNILDSESQSVQCTHCRLATRAWPTYAHIDILHTELESRTARF